MLDRRSQLAEHLKLGCFGAGKTPRVMLSEVRGRAIVQVAGWPDSFENVSKRLAEAAGGTGVFDSHADSGRHLSADGRSQRGVDAQSGVAGGLATLRSSWSILKQDFAILGGKG